MEIDRNYALNFATIIIRRGLGLFGREKIKSIAYNSDILLKEDDSVEFINENHDSSIERLLINFSENLVAKMTAVSLAQKYKIPIPNELQKKSKKISRFKKFFNRFK